MGTLSWSARLVRFAIKNHIIDAIFEYNTIRDTHRGGGVGISSHDDTFRGPENAMLRHNIIRGAQQIGIVINVKGSLSIDIIGNLILENTYQGIR